MTRLVSLFLVAVLSVAAAEPGGRAKCVGGTLPLLRIGVSGQVITTDPQAFLFVASASQAVRIPYDRINLLEYGQQVNRRVLLAFVVSPMFLLTKARAHYLTIGFMDAEGQQQALLLRLDKNSVRATLAALEARSGRSITYQDEDARKSHRGG